MSILTVVLWPFWAMGTMAGKLIQGLMWLLSSLWNGTKFLGQKSWDMVSYFPKKIISKFRKPEPKPLNIVEQIAALITDEGEIPKDRGLVRYNIPSNWTPGPGFEVEPSKIQIKSWTHGPAGYRGVRRLVKQNWTERLRAGQIRIEKSIERTKSKDNG